MIDYSKKSQTIKYFASIMNDLKKSKVRAIFSLRAPFGDHNKGYRTYSIDTELYILLENDYCLVIDYRYIDELDIQFRRLTSLELDAYRSLPKKTSLTQSMLFTIFIRVR